jgi:hypothetical protein
MTRYLAIAIALAACGKGDKADKTGDKAGGGKAAPAVAIDAAAVNALVPDALKAKLVFEKRDVVLERTKTPTVFTLAAPKDWTQTSKMFGNLEPASGGFGTELKVGTNCDGQCEPKDWAAIADKTHFAPLASAKVIKDDKATKGKRTMIAEDGDATHVIVVWWTDGADEYFTCTAKLGSELKDAAPAFEKACQAVGYSKG